MSTKYTHVEAFCLMLYQGRTSKRVIDIWNSRDGVTPINAFIDGEEFVHIAFSFDRRVPMHELRPGDYFFRDITEDEATRIAASRVDRFEPHLTERERAKQISELIPHFLRNGESNQPYLDRAPFITAVVDENDFARRSRLG